MAEDYYWVISGYRGTNKLCEFKVKKGYFSDNAMKNLLRCLTAKHALDDSEIISTFARRNTKISAPLLLEVRREKPNSLSCGINPYFSARVVKE